LSKATWIICLRCQRRSGSGSEPLVDSLSVKLLYS
jgi:hypothetical protein